MKKLLIALLTMTLALCPLIALGEGQSRPIVRITVENYGNIYAELYPEYAPITVENFLGLVNQGFYDGLTFHRVISGFMIQGGDPLGNGTGGSNQKIKGEFSANGVENPLQHARGVLSMARSSDMNSASSQFFIMHDDSAYLDGQYAAFGRVIAGQWVVDRICMETPVQDNNGTVLKEDQPVISAIRVVDENEAEQAARAEQMNGAPNTVFVDPVTPLCFPVPEGWRILGQSAESFTFGSADSPEKPLLIFRQNSFDTLSADYKAQLADRGVTRQDMDTDMYQKSSLVGMTRLDESQFEEEIHSGVKFYAAQGDVGDSQVTYYIGANDGYIYVFVFGGSKNDEQFPHVTEILDQMTFREMP